MYILYIHIILMLLMKELLRPRQIISCIFMRRLNVIMYMHVSSILKRVETSDLPFLKILRLCNITG